MWATSSPYVSVTNPVHGLPLTHHQRSLAHHMDSCTTLQTTIPITDDTRTEHTAYCTEHTADCSEHTADCTDHTTYLNHGLPLPLCRVLFSI